MTITCAFPPEVDDRQLLAYVDGEADKETISHLQDCRYCRQKAERLAQFQKRLITRLYRHTCPTSVELGEYHFHLLPAPQMLVIGQHLRECTHCAREIAQLESFLKDQITDAESSLLGQAKLLIARLVNTGEFAVTQASAALRGEEKVPMIFAADGIVIALDVQASAAGRVTILGQVAADNQSDWTGALVELQKDNKLQFSSTINDMGAFRFEEVIPGQHELRIIPAKGPVIIMANFEIPA